MHIPDWSRELKPQEAVEAVKKRRGSGGSDTTVGAQESTAIEIAVSVTLDVRVSDATFAKMTTQFDTTQFVEITTAIAAYNMVPQILVPPGVEQ